MHTNRQHSFFLTQHDPSHCRAGEVDVKTPRQRGNLAGSGRYVNERARTRVRLTRRVSLENQRSWPDRGDSTGCASREARPGGSPPCIQRNGSIPELLQPSEMKSWAFVGHISAFFCRKKPSFIEKSGGNRFQDWIAQIYCSCHVYIYCRERLHLHCA